MKLLYDQQQFELSKGTDKFPSQCAICSKVYYKTKRDILKGIKLGGNNGKYCSQKCKNIDLHPKNILRCKNCNSVFEKQLSQIKKTKNHFCSKPCAATYNNTHKTKGNRRSKLEIYLEEQLTKFYPDLDMDFNKTDTIESELDIYIPSLKLAFELNGIFHYEPIYGQEKLDRVQNNDNRKFQACIERGIELCIIDTSQQKYFKEKSSQKYLKIITDLLSRALDSNQ